MCHVVILEMIRSWPSTAEGEPKHLAAAVLYFQPPQLSLDINGEIQDG